MALKLGKLPYKASPRDLKFSKYLKVELLPTIPDQYGDEALIPAWGMLANDTVGDCVIAAIWHMIILWNKAAGKTINVSPQTAINTYSAITGYDPADPSTDQGTDERSALVYALNTGFMDDDGVVHKIGGFVNIDVANQSHLDAAAYLFEATLLGIQFPDSAMTQFQNNQVWDVVDNASIEGGHGITNVAKRANRVAVSWGATVSYTQAFQQAYLEEAWGVWSPEMFANGKTLEGFDQVQLLADQQAVQSE